MTLDSKVRAAVLRAQKDEITEYYLYLRLARRVTKEGDRRLLEKIAGEELAHYNFFKKFSNEEVPPSRWRIFFYYFIARLFGLNFGVRLMERSENLIQSFYGDLRHLSPEVEHIIREEQQHEERMLDLIDQEELAYTGSVVLGLNDALVELTGVLAGLTLALQDTRIVAIAGFITGIAASLSMAGSEYLSTKEEGGKSPLRASIYTGIAYIVAVLFLITPYFIFSNPFICLALAVSFALLIVFIFTFYISVAKNLSFKKRFMEMAAISLGVAILNFFIGLLVRKYLHIDV
ncbi:MAG: VIT1/CCC1 transporter family protein [bacterium]|jgi:VIT1/CCC1 family predicted Fe2+/Mn2+ transporter